MILADTCIWIDFLKGKEPTFTQLKKLLMAEKVLAFEPIFAELLQGVKNKREQEIVLGYWHNLPQANEQGIWIRAGLESNRNKWLSSGVGLIDSVILIHARTHQCKLWTIDKKLMEIAEPDELYRL